MERIENWFDQLPMSAEEERLYVAILHKEQPPDRKAYQAGRDAHANGTRFHEGPRPFFTVEALSWRMGWNERALENRD